VRACLVGRVSERRPRQCCTACISCASPAAARLCTQQPSPAPLGPQGNQWQAPDPALHGALFVLLAAHLMPSFPPHYVVFQTEQWGHPLLAEGGAAWGPAHGGAARRDCGAVFRGAVEARRTAAAPAVFRVNMAPPSWANCAVASRFASACLAQPTPYRRACALEHAGVSCAARRAHGEPGGPHPQVWDYSEQHVMQWRRHFAGAGVTFRYVPFAWFPAPQVRPHCWRLPPPCAC